VTTTAAEDVGKEPNGESETGGAGTTELIAEGIELSAGGTPTAELIADGTTDTTLGVGGIVAFWGIIVTPGPAGISGAVMSPIVVLMEYPKASGKMLAFETGIKRRHPHIRIWFLVEPLIDRSE
jgi:hypothetical protein